MKDVAPFWDKIAKKYASDPISNMADYEHTREIVRSYLTSETRVLELGCGTGSTAVELAMDADRYHGTDISSGMIEIANAKKEALGIPGLSFEVAEVSKALSSGDYDMILGFNLLHLLENPGEIVRAGFDRLAPGGLFITKTSCLKGAGFFYRPMIGVMRIFGKAPFVGFLSTAELEAMFRNAGFEIVETYAQNESPPRHFIVARHP